MSTPVMPVVPPAELSDSAAANAPDKDSERARRLRRERDEAIAEGEVPAPDIAGISEQHRAARRKR